MEASRERDRAVARGHALVVAVIHDLLAVDVEHAAVIAGRAERIGAGLVEEDRAERMEVIGVIFGTHALHIRHRPSRAPSAGVEIGTEHQRVGHIVGPAREGRCQIGVPRVQRLKLTILRVRRRAVIEAHLKPRAPEHLGRSAGCQRKRAEHARAVVQHQIAGLDVQHAEVVAGAGIERQGSRALLHDTSQAVGPENVATEGHVGVVGHAQCGRAQVREAHRAVRAVQRPDPRLARVRPGKEQAVREFLDRRALRRLEPHGQPLVAARLEKGDGDLVHAGLQFDVSHDIAVARRITLHGVVVDDHLPVDEEHAAVVAGCGKAVAPARLRREKSLPQHGEVAGVLHIIGCREARAGIQRVEGSAKASAVMDDIRRLSAQEVGHCGVGHEVAHGRDCSQRVVFADQALCAERHAQRAAGSLDHTGDRSIAEQLQRSRADLGVGKGSVRMG